MMKSMPGVWVLFSLFLGSALAQPAAKPATGLVSKPMAIPSPRTVDPAARSNMLAKTGGVLLSPITGPSLLFLNTQARVPADALREVPAQILKIMRLPCTFSDKASQQPIADAVKAAANTNTTAAVVVIGECADYPALLVAPESRWALVNVAALNSQGVSPEKLAERTQKEVWRAAGFLMGAANSAYEHCLLKPVFSASDLDALPGKSVGPETMNKIMLQAQRMGMKAARPTTYRKAVEEGWAPAPTNDFQRAIWQELGKTPAK